MATIQPAEVMHLEVELALEFVRVVEEAAIESAKTMGLGDAKTADGVAVKAMRRVMDTVPMYGTIVIGEGERDEAPMLYIGEKVGAKALEGVKYPEVDIAVDPLEGTNLCATGARIRLIGDGDLSAGIAAAVLGTGVHAVMGIGGAPEGVITAAAMRCLNGEILARLVVDTPELEERVAKMGIKDKNRIYRAEDLAPGQHILFAATGVTDGSLLRGVRFFGDGTRTQSLIMTHDTGKVRFVDSIHVPRG